MDNTVFLTPGPFETFGIGVLEALSSGMIVIGPDAGGTGEMLASMNSPLLFKAGNAESFYKTIMKALECDLQKESRRSIDKSREFASWSTAIERIMQFYEKKKFDAGIRVDEEKSSYLHS